MQEIEERREDYSQGAGGATNGIALLAGGAALGALLMYLFDPDRGRGRRARLGDQLASKCSRMSEATGAKARHLRNRAKGLMHEARSILPGGGGTGREGQNSEGANQGAAGAADQGA